MSADRLGYVCVIVVAAVDMGVMCLCDIFRSLSVERLIQMTSSLSGILLSLFLDSVRGCQNKFLFIYLIYSVVSFGNI